MDLDTARQRLEAAIKTVRMPTRSESLRASLKYLHGRRCRNARRLIKSQLDWHGRWTAEAIAALNPWHVESMATIWAWAALGCPVKKRRWPKPRRSRR